MEALTKAEEKIMQRLWKLKAAFLGEIVESMPEPRPHRNTVATILKILAEKGFVGVEPMGRNNRYTPLIKRSDYSRSRIKSLARRYFEGSYIDIVSAMARDNSLSVEDLEVLIEELKKKR